MNIYNFETSSVESDHHSLPDRAAKNSETLQLLLEHRGFIGRIPPIVHQWVEMAVPRKDDCEIDRAFLWRKAPLPTKENGNQVRIISFKWCSCLLCVCRFQKRKK